MNQQGERLTMDEDKSTEYKTYIDNGILYYEFTHTLSVDNVLAAETEAFKIIADRNIRLVPTVVLFKDIDQSKVQMGVFDLGKVVSIHNILKYASGIWFVGAEGQVKRLAGALNTVFLGGRVHFVATLDEAKAAAEANKTEENPLLEQ